MSLKRRRGLRPDPERVREFNQRARETSRLGRGQGLKRSATPMKPGRRKRKATIPKPIRAAVKQRQGGKCLVPGCKRRIAHLHHVLPEQSFAEVATHEDNFVGLCWPDHDEHERAIRRLHREWLPSASLALAKRLGPRAEVYVERTYPPTEAAVAGRFPA